MSFLLGAGALGEFAIGEFDGDDGTRTAILNASADLVAATLLYRVAFASLPGSSDLIAMPVVTKAASTVWLTSASLTANPLLRQPFLLEFLSSSAFLLASADVVQPPGHASANLVSSSTLRAATLLYRAAVAQWDSSSTLAADTRLYQVTSATWLASTSLIAAPRQLMQVNPVLGGVANLILAVTLVTNYATSVLSASSSLVANAVYRRATFATLSGSASILAAAVYIRSTRATLSAGATILASPFIFDVLDARRLIPGGNSGFYGPTAHLVDLPAPKRTLKKRKQLTQPNLPPEAFLPAPLPPPFVREAKPLIAMPTAKPLGTFKSPIEGMAGQIKNETAHAVDESSDLEDAVMVLKQLMLI